MKNFYLILVFLCFLPSAVHALEQNIFIAPMEEFSGLSRATILEKRTEAVKNSIFRDMFPDYTPSSSVFQIEDNLPWISAHEITCYGHGTKGASRESQGVLNPELLYYLIMPAYNFSKYSGCSEKDYLSPYKLTYNPDGNTITAYIDYTSFYQKNRAFFRNHLSDTNARDLGYQYAFADKVENIRFAENTNLSTTISPTRGFYHRGGSCGVEGGCNNYSPRQYELEFYLTDLPAELDIKLWKNYPSNQGNDADIRYHLIFE